MCEMKGQSDQLAIVTVIYAMLRVPQQYTIAKILLYD